MLASLLRLRGDEERPPSRRAAPGVRALSAAAATEEGGAAGMGAHWTPATSKSCGLLLCRRVPNRAALGMRQGCIGCCGSAWLEGSPGPGITSTGMHAASCVRSTSASFSGPASRDAAFASTGPAGASCLPSRQPQMTSWTTEALSSSS